MSEFLNIALEHADRGWYVFPCWPRSKKPMTAHGWKDATLDREQITAWWTKTPDANVAIACAPSDLAVLDIDHGLPDDNAALMWLGAHNVPGTYMVRTGRRPEYGLQIYFRGAIPDVGLWQLDGCEGQIKSLGGYVMAAGSIHPDSGKAYTVKNNVTLADTPGWVRALRSFQLPVVQAGPMQKIPEGSGRHAALTSVAGTFRSKGFDEDAVLMQLIPANEAMCEVPVSHEDLEHIAQSVCRYPIAAPTPGVTIGGKKASAVEVTEDVEIVEELDAVLTAVPLPPYPVDVFEGTILLEFAKRAQQGNFVPLEFLLEGGLTYAAAVVSDYLHGSRDEVQAPRLYTVLIGPPGVGKGTTFKRIRNFIPPSRRYSAVSDTVMPPPCSVLTCAVASENGLNDALLQRPSVILDIEELDVLFEKTGIQGSGGSLMSIIRTCFDDTDPRITKCKGRDEVASKAYLSVLGAITPSLWRKAMEGKDSYGSGLGGRFNLVATNETRIASSLNNMDTRGLHEEMERRFAALDAETLTIPTEPDALRVLDAWWVANAKGQPHYNRVNVIAHRKALMLAWLRGLPVITSEVMGHAVKLAEYLVGVRDVFAVTKGEDKTAIGENRILHILRQVSPKAVRASQLVELLDGLMSRASVFRALKSLADSGETERLTVRTELPGSTFGARRFAPAKPYSVYRVSLK